MDTPPQDPSASPKTELIRDRKPSAAKSALLDFSAMESTVTRFLGATLSDQYELLEIIGEGGMGIVFRARQITVDRDVAIKVLHRHLAKDERCVGRFENEARAISRLRHPNTLRLYDTQRTPDGDLFIVTELLSGQPLSKLLYDEYCLPLDRALRIVDHVCRSLSEAHSEGIIHRDLKPENVFLDRVGSEEMVKVLDFGIAKILQDNANLTKQGFVSGTPLYMSPEQAMGQPLDPRTDVYSLGVMLYEMLTGSPPFNAKSAVQICAMHVASERPRLSMPHLGPTEERVEKLVHKMMAIRPADRHASVDELREEMAQVAATLTPVSSPLIAVERPTLPADPPRQTRARRVEVLTDQPSITGGVIPSGSFALDDIRAEAQRMTQVGELVADAATTLPLDRDRVNIPAASRGRRWTLPLLAGGIGLLAALSAVLAFFGAETPAVVETTDPAPVVAPPPVAPAIAPAPVPPQEPPKTVVSPAVQEAAKTKRVIAKDPPKRRAKPKAEKKKEPVLKPSDELEEVNL